MKTLFTLLFVGALLCAPFMATAQEDLASGTYFFTPVVIPQLAYRDILRAETEGWTREEFVAQQNAWRNLELAVSSKDARGGYAELSTALWDKTNNIWQNNYKTTYNSIYNGSNLVEEKEIITSYGGNTSNVKNVYTYYPNKTEKQIDVYYNNGGSYSLVSNVYVLYDANNKRRVDSVVLFNPTRSVVTYYTYDNNGQCIERLERNVPVYFGTDTVSQALYEYYNTGELKRLVTFYGVANLPWVEREVREYTYTQAGKVDKLYFWYRQTQNTSLDLLAIYGHYYANNKLSSTTLHSFQAGQEYYTDSIVLNYLPNNQYDTAQIYRRGATPTSWATTPTHRMIFAPATTTGVATTAKPIALIKAYPNPTTNTLFVELEAPTDGITDLVVTDMAGKVLKNQPVQLLAGQTTTIALQTQGFAKGIYLLRVGSTTTKIIVE
jgi:hypothetical protein